MKKIILSLLLANLTIFGASSQEEINTNQDSKDLPEIYFEKTTHDFGKIEYQGDGTCEFTFKNTGNEPLLLTNVRASCGCTTPTWPKEPLKKGEKGTITVKYNTRIIGNFTKTIRVYSNAKTTPIMLKITGTVQKPDETKK
ncbi:MAG: DUF1573 domain-containing protein [Bacteroidales bacterium]|jgi:hypothetical protein|nr:DUF1573 domain-containing protein [Bacteroidales bacterium]